MRRNRPSWCGDSVKNTVASAEARPGGSGASAAAGGESLPSAGMASIADRVHRLSVEEYLRLAVGNPEWGRTELIEGVVYDVTPESALHADAVHAVRQALEMAFPEHRVRDVGSVRLADDSLWEPDVYVAPHVVPLPQYPTASDLRLVVEVSISSLRQDLDQKSPAYAANGVPEYWVLVPDVGGYLVRHTRPGADGYGSMQRVEMPGGYGDLDVRSVLAL